MKPIFFILALLISKAPVFGADLVMTLIAPSEPVAPGGEIHLDLVAVNPRSGDVPFAVPDAIAAQLRADHKSWSVSLAAATPSPISVPSGGFATRRYRLAVPYDAVGSILLELQASELQPLRAVFDVSIGATSVDSPIAQLNGSATTASMIARTFAGRFMPNMPIYFIYGSGTQQAAKFQFSFDYRLASLSWSENQTATLRLGYTQRSLWDIDASSSPFYDTSYMPEIAINTDAPHSAKNGSWFTWIGLRTGFQHESNGRDGVDSRSLNRVYLRPRFMLGSVDSWYFIVLPELHAYVGGFGENARIKDYRGYGNLRLYLGKNDSPCLIVTGWTGRDFDHASYQLELMVPVRSRRLNIEAFLMAQYFDGYGESLRSYERKSNALRFGVALLR